MYNSCESKQNDLKKTFSSCKDSEARYMKIIELGKTPTNIDPKFKTEENLVKGCQSRMYLHSSLSDHGTILFAAESDALISQGLAALLLMVYNDESPEAILKCPPSFLDELKIPGSLTPNRANGLYSLHLKMKQDALKLMIENQKAL